MFQQPTTNNQQPTTNQFKFINLLFPAILGLTLSLGGCTSSGGSENSSDSGSSGSNLSLSNPVPKNQKPSLSQGDIAFLDVISVIETGRGINTNHGTNQTAKDFGIQGNHGISTVYFGGKPADEVLNELKIDALNAGGSLTVSSLAATWKGGPKAASGKCYRDAGGVYDTTCNYAQMASLYFNDSSAREKGRTMGWLNHWKELNLSKTSTPAVSQPAVTTKPVKPKVEEKTLSTKTFPIPANGKCGQGYWSNDQKTCKPI